MNENEDSDIEDDVDHDSHLRAYEEYSKTVKGWFIAYGVGAPVLFLTQDNISKAIIKSGEGKCIVSLFLVGVVLQVFIALVNKWNNWHIHFAYNNEKKLEEQTKLVQFCCLLSQQSWIDICIDVLTFVLFIWASTKVFLIFAI
ncbi:MAG TPA: hypothetical protein ENI76_09365 [Ignavibacteria bacterium]|nr:hypothetical protein [Ignavibacteria bacterium]